jgi:hypothetical protein
MFPKRILSRSCDEYEVDRGKTFGYGVLDISRVHIVSFMGAFVEGVLRPLFAMQHFSKPLPLIYYGLNIECYVQWKVKSITMALGIWNTLSAICNGK